MVNRLRQLKQLQGMDNRTARQDARMQYLQQNYGQQAPQAPQAPMPQAQPAPWQPLQPAGPQDMMRQPMPMPRGGIQNTMGQLSPEEAQRFQEMMRTGQNPMSSGSYQPAIDAGAKIATMPMSQNQGVTGSLTAAPGIERSGYDSGMRSPLQRSHGVSGFLTRAPGIERSGYDSGIMSPLQQSQGVSGFLTNAPGAERSGYRYNRGRGPLAIKRGRNG